MKVTSEGYSWVTSQIKLWGKNNDEDDASPRTDNWGHPLPLNDEDEITPKTEETTPRTEETMFTPSAENTIVLTMEDDPTDFDEILIDTSPTMEEFENLDNDLFQKMLNIKLQLQKYRKKLDGMKGAGSWGLANDERSTIRAQYTQLIEEQEILMKQLIISLADHPKRRKMLQLVDIGLGQLPTETLEDETIRELLKEAEERSYRERYDPATGTWHQVDKEGGERVNENILDPSPPPTMVESVSDPSTEEERDIDEIWKIICIHCGEG